MSTSALVFESDRPFLVAGATCSTLTGEARLAGLTLVRRAILMCWRCGMKEVVLVARDSEAAQRWRETEVGLPIPVTVLQPGQTLPMADPPAAWVVFSALLLPFPHQLERVTQSLVETRGEFGPARLTGETHTEVIDPAALIQTVLELPPRSPDGEDLGPVRRLGDTESLREADRAMYVGLTSQTDGWVDRVFNRHISRVFTRLIINTPITPNAVTWFHLCLGLLGTWLFSLGDHLASVVGAIVLQLSVAIDCSDGEVARLKYQFSEFGGRLDVIADNVVNIALFAAIAHASRSRLGDSLALQLLALSVLGVIMSVVVVFGLGRLLDRFGSQGALAVTRRLAETTGETRKDDLVAVVINEVTSRDFSIIVVALALVHRLEWFTWLAGIGSHVFWITFGAIQLHRFRRAAA